jgi:protein-tyrosine phosphatase
MRRPILLALALALFLTAPASAQPPVPRVAPKPVKVLFICSGNYYRSRFAEAYLEHVAAQKQLRVVVSSRGTALVEHSHLVSPLVTAELERRGIPASLIDGPPVQLTEADLKNADVIVGLNKPEHEPAMKAKFPTFDLSKAVFWDVPDVGELPSPDAFARIARYVDALARDIETRRR